MRLPKTPPLVVLLLAVLVPAAAMIPTCDGYHCQQLPDKVFMGFRYMSFDHYQYAALVRQVQDGGGLLMYDPFASEPQRGVFVLPLFWAMGILSRTLGGGVVVWWEIFRVVGGALYILLFWRMTSLYLHTQRGRILATGLFSLGGGLDWGVLLLHKLGVPGAAALLTPFNFQWNWSTFGTMLMPNWVWPALFLPAAVLAACASSRSRHLLLLVLLPVMWFLHPYSGIVGYMTFAFLPAVPLVVAALGPAPMPWARARAHLRVVLPAMLSALPIAAYALWARQDPVYRAVSDRVGNWTDHYSIWWYPLSYGLLLPLAWFGARAMAKEASLRAELMLAWLAAAVFLAVNPLYAGGKFQYLVFPPMALLAARGLLDLHARLSWLQRLVSSRAGVAALAAVLSLNSLSQLFKDLPDTSGDTRIFMSASELAAMRWLDKQPEGVVLSGARAGDRLPWLSGKRTYLGHWFMTPNRPEKARNSQLFFSQVIPIAARTEILAASRARYVYVGPEEQQQGFSAIGMPLHLVYQHGQHTIYEVGSGDAAIH